MKLFAHTSDKSEPSEQVRLAHARGWEFCTGACRFVGMICQKHSKTLAYHSNFFLPIVRNVYAEVSRDFARFHVITVQSELWWKICSYVVSSSHRGTLHTVGAKLLNLALFVLIFVVSHI